MLDSKEEITYDIKIPQTGNPYFISEPSNHIGTTYTFFERFFQVNPERYLDRKKYVVCILILMIYAFKLILLTEFRATQIDVSSIMTMSVWLGVYSIIFWIVYIFTMKRYNDIYGYEFSKIVQLGILLSISLLYLYTSYLYMVGLYLHFSYNEQIIRFLSRSEFYEFTQEAGILSFGVVFCILIYGTLRKGRSHDEII